MDAPQMALPFEVGPGASGTLDDRDKIPKTVIEAYISICMDRFPMSSHALGMHVLSKIHHT